MIEQTELRHGKSWRDTAHALRLAMAGQTVLIMGTLTRAQVELVSRYVFGIDTGTESCIRIEVIDDKVTRIMPIPAPIMVQEMCVPKTEQRKDKYNDVTGFYERNSRHRRY